MKKLQLFLLFFSFGIVSFGQDVIIKTNGEEIQAKVLEISTSEIKYKRFDNPEGPNYIIEKSKVFMIKYENGNKDVFNNSTGDPTQPSPKPVVTSPIPVVPRKPEFPDKPFYNNKHHYYFSMSLGYGPSYGGLGLRMQARSGGEVGFGFHWGTGYLPTFNFLGMGVDENTFMASAGFKLFPYKYLYIDTQFGIFGKEYIAYDLYYDAGEMELLYGPSFTAGVDWIFGKHLGFNAGGGISLPVTGTYQWEMFPAVDLGFLIKF
jgi:hypothetical protein